MTDQIKSDINALIDSDPPRTALPAIEPVGGYPAQRGRASYASPAAAAGGGSASGEYTEVPGTRTYHDPHQLVLPESGFFFYEVVGVASIQFKSGGDALKFNLEQPDYAEPDP